ncbi:non-functional pseudokinase ZED1-like [Olea europaea subsp. europaea]|uniref:Non-functional pseudokinase ZED1-like n=1 Tax=Olea europaea subsp. europaea TaxID=158383 RepID=A0A8S0RWG6_OLEEU|nr:non-functional pseudokinase ZED1-like [Olea europaea subsp. europaea]
MDSLMRREFKSRKKETETHFLKNGSALLEELITTFSPRYKIPIRNFNAEEIIKATNGFAKSLDISNFDGSMYTGFLENRPILVKKFQGSDSSIVHRIIRDVAINSQMSHHKNVLKLIGRSLEFEYPALVYNFCRTQLLSDLLFASDSALPWKNRLKIANDIANVVVYLHTAFSTPIIFRDLKPRKVIIDEHGVAKLFSFSLCISLPPGEMQVKDIVCGSVGHLDPAYASSGIVTQKTDVFSFGILLLELLTGRRTLSTDDEDFSPLLHGVIKHIGKDEFDEIVDPKILEAYGGVEEIQQKIAFLYLALRCVDPEEDDRPFMIDVAKELRKIERSPHQLSPQRTMKNTIVDYSSRKYSWLQRN